MEFRKKLRDFFIPSLQNQLRPYSLRFTTLVFVVAMSVAIEILFYAYVNVAFKKNDLLGNIISSIQSTVAETLPQVILGETNAAREKNGQKPLALSEKLAQAARLKAEDMARQGYFSHQSPDGSMAWDFMGKTGYRYSYAGENLAVNFFDASDVVKAWMNSPTHRANIVNSDYREIGIAAVRGNYQGKDTVFVVQMFGTPGAPEFASKNYAMATTSVPKKAVAGVAEPSASSSQKSAELAAATGTVATTTTTFALAKAGEPVNAEPKGVSLKDRYLVSPRHLARDAYIALLLYMFICLIIPMYMIYRNHASADQSLRFREIFVLFRQPIISALVTFVCVTAVMSLNYFWSKNGTNIYQAAIGLKSNSINLPVNQSK